MMAGDLALSLCTVGGCREIQTTPNDGVSAPSRRDQYPKGWYHSCYLHKYEASKEWRRVVKHSGGELVKQLNRINPQKQRRGVWNTRRDISATDEGEDTYNTAFRCWAGSVCFYKAYPIRPKALKANRALTPLESAELVEELEVELGFVELEVGVPLMEEVKVTPCTKSDKG